MLVRSNSRAFFLACSALTATALSTAPAWAQDEASSEFSGLGEIIVTAQKREQSLQDVPVAVTALAGDTLLANRIVSVNDLSGLAPGLTVRPAPGSSSIPSFSTRGAVSYGVVPGSDKQISMYLDGVYLSSPRGSIFDLPDTQRIEMLRGPQGTLFGRNATAGAVSVSTRDPSGEAQVKVSGTVGNRDNYRFAITAELPQIGPFSAYGTFAHDEFRGPVRNVGPAQVWDRSASLSAPRMLRTSKWLGSKNSDSYFGAVKFDPGSNFVATYKFDKNNIDNTPSAVGFAGYNPSYSLAGVYKALIESQTIPVSIASNQRRPEFVNNLYSTPGTVNQEGHNLTFEYTLSDQISIKNIAAHRKSSITSHASLVGLELPVTREALTAYSMALVAPRQVPGFAQMTPEQKAAANGNVVQGLINAGYLGVPFISMSSGSSSRSSQWSNELQVNYDSDFVTLTTGGLYFTSKDHTNEHGFPNSLSLTIAPNGIEALRPGINFNKAESYAAYAQGEFHITPALDVILGGRVTHDKKSGSFSYGTLPNLTKLTFDYSDTRFNYLVGLNYKPNADTLVYAKWSTAYVSGGKVGPVAFDAETAKSAELGVKADFFDRRLRANLAVYWAEYKNYQTTQGVTVVGPDLIEQGYDPNVVAVLGTLVYPQGDVEAKGFELELTAAPVDGVTLGGSLGYNHTKATGIPALLKTSVGLPTNTPDKDFIPTYRPKWTGNVYAQYKSQPIFDESYISLRADANYQSKINFTPRNYKTYDAEIITAPAYWLVNARAAIEDIEVGGLNATLALWGKNLFDKDVPSFPMNAAGLSGAIFIDARAYGLDFSVRF